jgi:hypothetical protein
VRRDLHTKSSTRTEVVDLEKGGAVGLDTWSSKAKGTVMRKRSQQEMTECDDEGISSDGGRVVRNRVEDKMGEVGKKEKGKKRTIERQTGRVSKAES